LIFDTISNIKNFIGISKDFDAAIFAILETDFTQLSPGTYPVSNSNSFFMVQTPKLQNRDKTRWECHDQHIDIQYIVTGGPEIIDWTSRHNLSGWEKEPSADVYFSEDDLFSPSSTFRWIFCCFFPQDAHRPCQGEYGTKSLKVVFKIPVFDKWC